MESICAIWTITAPVGVPWYVRQMPLVALDGVSLAYGHLPLLDRASMQIDAGERIAVIGRNSSGKSTLLQVMSGETLPDSGTVWRQPTLAVARLVQDVPLTVDRCVAEIVAEGLEPVAAAHREEWRNAHQVDQILSRLELAANVPVNTLS